MPAATRVITDILPGYVRHTSGRRSVGFYLRLSHEPALPALGLRLEGDRGFFAVPAAG